MRLIKLRRAYEFFLCRLEHELRSKQERIEELKKEFDDKMYSLEKQAVLDKDRYT